MRIWWLSLTLWGLTACASGDENDASDRPIREFSVTIDREVVVPSSVIAFQVLNSADRSATGAEITVAGVLEGGQQIRETFDVPVTRVSDSGDLVARLRVFDGLFAAVAPTPSRRFSGAIELELRDAVGVFGKAYLEDLRLQFEAQPAPGVSRVDVPAQAHVHQAITVPASAILTPDEGVTWAVVDAAQITHSDGSIRQVTNARTALTWSGQRDEGTFHLDPAVFGVRVARFQGHLRFENVLKTGEVFTDETRFDVDTTLQKSRVEGLDPPAGSRGQKIRIAGRGFLPENLAAGSGMYLRFEGTFTPANPAIEPRVYQGTSAVFRVPHAVLDERNIDQHVWADVTPNGQLTGLGATPGRFEGTITPVLFDVTGEEIGEAWSGRFDVLPTKQVVYVRYLPGFAQALKNYGLQYVEHEVRSRILYVLRRDYAQLNVEFVDSPPTDWVEYTTIEVGGPDPSGLYNFGYDNSFNDGGKDIGNLYLSDYLGGVNIHSKDAGYLPYGGVFIESFAAFSPKLFPDSFGTSESFDRIMGSVMPSLGGVPVSAEEWPDGMRATAIEAAINLVGTLAGHTASHEVGHSFGMAYFPDTVDGFAERFHNDPPGNNWLMDAGSDRPFEERAEIDGHGPATFNANNRAYLERILPLP